MPFSYFFRFIKKEYIILASCLFLFGCRSTTDDTYVYPNAIRTFNYNFDFIDKTYVIIPGGLKEGFREDRHNLSFSEISLYASQKFTKYGLHMVDNIDEADYVMVLSYSSSYGEDVWFETEYYNYEEPVFQNYLDVYFFDRKAFLKSESQPEFDLKELYAVQIRMEKTYFEANTRTFKGLIDRVLYNFPRKSGYSIININQY